MKAFASLILFAVLLHAARAAEPIPVPKETADQIEQLLDSMISQAEAQKSYHLAFPDLQHPAIPNLKETEIEEAKNQLIKYSQDRLRVRSLLKVGTSVLAYPGLLAHGEITYSPSHQNFFGPSPDKTIDAIYSLYVGLFKGRGKGPENFEINFGSNGVIRTVSSKY